MTRPAEWYGSTWVSCHSFFSRVVERFENDFSRVIIVEAVVWRRRRLAACWFVVGRELVEVEDGEVTVEEKEREGWLRSI